MIKKSSNQENHDKIKVQTMNDLEIYGKLLSDIKSRVRTAQIKATLSANAEMLAMYFDIGEMVFNQQQQYAWGAKIIQKLAFDIKNELPKEKGFSERNLKFMVQFYLEYKQEFAIGKQSVSQLETDKTETNTITKQLVSQIPWGHNILLMQKIKDHKIKLKYIQQTITEGWTRDVLASMIKSNWHEREGQVVSNFESTLPQLQSEYAGKLNFYCSAVDDLLKHPTDQPTIGLILCQTKDKIFAEYALKDINKPIGISEYELTKAIPDKLKSSLPSIDEIEKELGGQYNE